jgi:hypothetical protein
VTVASIRFQPVTMHMLKNTRTFEKRSMVNLPSLPFNMCSEAVDLAEKNDIGIFDMSLPARY